VFCQPVICVISEFLRRQVWSWCCRNYQRLQHCGERKTRS